MSRRRASLAGRLRRDTAGTAAAEMALVVPLMLAIGTGAYDLGNFFASEHVVVKAVRDGARYASRREYTAFTCAAASADVVDKTRNLTRTGTIASGGAARLYGWTAASSITVSVSCNTSTSYAGMYTGLAGGIPVVTVTAAVPYRSLFNAFGLTRSTLTLNAKSQAAVTGT